MFKSYFFIPGSHQRIQEKLDSLPADRFIIDLEESFDLSTFQACLDNIASLPQKENLWVRPNLFRSRAEDERMLHTLIQSGYVNFLLPKLRTPNQLQTIEDFLLGKGPAKAFSLMILVENPEGLLNLASMLQQTKLTLTGIAFGSQDYCSEARMPHLLEHLRIPRFQIANTAKAFGLEAIDIACMDTEGKQNFLKELVEMKAFGYDGKFIVHPRQLEVFNAYPFYSETEILEAKNVVSKYTELGEPRVFLHNGRIMESPHLKAYRDILNWSRKHGRK